VREQLDEGRAVFDERKALLGNASRKQLTCEHARAGPSSMTGAEAAVISAVIICASARLDGTIAATRNGS
jgi:hypothetical protein